MTSEKDVEMRLRQEVRKIGGIAYKFRSPNNSGVPDRICLFPGGRIVFVEVKAPGEKMRDLQVRQKQKIQALGFRVEQVSNYEQVDLLVGRYVEP